MSLSLRAMILSTCSTAFVSAASGDLSTSKAHDDYTSAELKDLRARVDELEQSEAWKLLACNN